MARFAIIGLGRFGMRLARTMAGLGAEVIAIDRSRTLIERIQDDVSIAVRLDSTDEEALRAQGIHDVPVVVVGIGEDFESAALATAAVKSLGVPRVIARAQNALRGRILRRIGADEIVYPEHETADRWAHRLLLPKLERFVELGDDVNLIELVAPPSFIGKTPRSLALREKLGVTLVAIRRKAEGHAGAVSFWVPTAETEIQTADELLLIGRQESLEKLTS